MSMPTNPVPPPTETRETIKPPTEDGMYVIQYRLWAVLNSPTIVEVGYVRHERQPNGYMSPRFYSARGRVLMAFFDIYQCKPFDPEKYLRGEQ